jgi:ribosomal protein L9
MPKHAVHPKTASSAVDATKKTLEELFQQRDRTPPGSKEEAAAAEKIAEAIFPDSNAD